MFLGRNELWEFMEASESSLLMDQLAQLQGSLVSPIYR